MNEFYVRSPNGFELSNSNNIVSNAVWEAAEGKFLKRTCHFLLRPEETHRIIVVSFNESVRGETGAGFVIINFLGLLRGPIRSCEKLEGSYCITKLRQESEEKHWDLRCHRPGFIMHLEMEQTLTAQTPQKHEKRVE